MNLIPFTVIIIMILGLFSYSMFSNALSSKKESKMYRSYFQGLREVRNQKAEEAYLAQLSQKEKDKSLQEEDFCYFREKWEGAPLGRVNLYSLLGKEVSTEILFNATLNYLEKLYKQVFNQRNDKELIKKVLKTILKKQSGKLRNNQGLLDLSEITFKDPYLQQKYIKMLKGTNSYHLRKGQGYLPLKQVIGFEKSTLPPIQFNYANIILLESFFGEKVKRKIIEQEEEIQKEAKERKNAYALDEGVFRELTSRYNPHSNIASLFSFQNTSKSSPTYWTDPDTNITVRINSDYSD